MKFVNARMRALIVAAILILAISTVVPVSAKKTLQSYKASGTIDGYVDVWSSEIVSGRWSVNVKGENLTYKARYKELNLFDGEPEYSPVGSVDIFTHSFSADGFDIYGDTLVFWGTTHIRKVWRKLDGTTEVVRRDSYVTITITETTFYLDYSPPGPGPGVYDQDWDRNGTTTHFKR